MRLPLWLMLSLLTSTLFSPGMSLAQEADRPLGSNRIGADLVEFTPLHRAVAPSGPVQYAFGKNLEKIRILDVRPRADYDAGHIPLAVWVDAKRAQAIAASPGGLQDRDAWVEWTKPLGLTPETMVVLVDGGRQLDAARVWWLLRYLGVEKAGLVDGNFALWQSEGLPVTRDVPEVAPVGFPVAFQKNRLATRDDVQVALKSHDSRIVDARSVDEWLGKDVRAKRGGHMPTACRLEWTDFVDTQGRFAPRAKVAAMIAAAGIKPGEPVIAHCQSGGRASVDAFVFEALGHPTRNYYLSWNDWGNAEDTPITTAEQPAAPPSQAPPAGKPFTVEYDYKCGWGQADEFLALFRRNHLPILRERMKQGDILSISMTKPRIHTGEADRWDFRVTLVFKDAAQAFNIAADEPIKRRLFPDQTAYKAEEQRRFTILQSHTDLPVEAVDLDVPATAP